MKLVLDGEPTNGKRSVVKVLCCASHGSCHRAVRLTRFASLSSLAANCVTARVTCRPIALRSGLTKHTDGSSLANAAKVDGC